MASSAAHPPPRLGDLLRKLLIVALLIGAMLFLHRLALPGDAFDPRGLLALGFVILAAYTVGQLVEVVRLPHITGYLLAGILFGPSIAEVLREVVPWIRTVPPLDEGIVSQRVLHQLSLVDGLALALIALTAGGELKAEELRRSLGHVVATTLGMVVAVVAVITTYIAMVIAFLPGMLPAFSGLPADGAAGMALVVGSLAAATSPAVAIAVINSTRARGPVATTVLTGVVVGEITVVLLFSAISSVVLGLVGASGSISAIEALGHVGVSIVVGVAVGAWISLYLRYVGAELLLFLVATIFATTFILMHLHGEAAVAFIAAGLVVGNFSGRGETLIREVERLSGPVYVVFFALAGAKLHLDILWDMLPLALGLFGLRAVGVYFGATAGARLSGAPEVVQRYGWLGFVSQAGLAIALAGQARAVFPAEIGESLFSLTIAVIALAEMIGPVALQSALQRAGEIGGSENPEEADLPAETTPDPAPTSAWPEPEAGDPWGPQSPTGGDELDQAIGELEIDLRALVQQHVEARIDEHQAETEVWLRQLRREWLRALRRAITRAEEPAAAEAEDLREDIGQLAARWRDLAAELRGRPSLIDAAGVTGLLEAVDARAQALRREVRAGVGDAVLAPRPEGAWIRIRRALARLRNRVVRIRRTVFLRDLGRYHLVGMLPARFEPVVATLARGELHTMTAVAALFERIADDFEEAARTAERGAGPEEVHGWLVAARSRIDPLFRQLAVELSHIGRSATDEAARAVGDCVQAVRRDAAVVSTLDLPAYRRRYNQVFAERNRGVQALAGGVRNAGQLVASRRAQLALEIELIGLEARVRAVARRRGNELERHLRGRGPVQLALVATHLEHWLQHTRELLDEPPSAGALSRRLRRDAEPLVQRIRDARAALAQLVAGLSDEAWVTDLVDLLIADAMDLSEVYTVATAPLRPPTGGVPEAPATAEVAFRDLVSAFVESRVARELLDLTADLAGKAGEMAATLQEIERVATFNVELSCAELDVLDDAAPVAPETVEILRAMLVGAVGRSHHRLVRVTEVAELTADQTEQRVHDCVSSEFGSLREMILAGKVAELRTVWLRDVRIGKLARRAEAFGGWVPALWARSAAVGRRALGEERIEAIRAALGLPPRVERRELRAVFAPPEPAVDVPAVYRRLFSDLPLETGDLLAGRSTELERLRVALAPAGPLRAAAVVGVDQQSASAMASAVVRSDFAGVLRLDARAPVAVEQVGDWVARVAAVERHAVVVEGLHWLFVRRPGGMDAVERLLAGMIADRGRNAWLLVSDMAVWRFLCSATAVGDVTGTVVELAALTEEELERAMLARHGMSGYDVAFDADEDLGWQLQHVLLRGEDRDLRRRAAWFRTLHLASAGILQDALRLWMAAIVEVDDERAWVRMGAVPRPPLTRLGHLPEEVQVTLLETSRQGWTDEAQHARLFRVSQEAARAHLAGLRHLGLLVPEPGSMPSGSGEVLRIAPHLRGAVHRALGRRGWT